MRKRLIYFLLPLLSSAFLFCQPVCLMAKETASEPSCLGHASPQSPVPHCDDRGPDHRQPLTKSPCHNIVLCTEEMFLTHWAAQGISPVTLLPFSPVDLNSASAAGVLEREDLRFVAANSPPLSLPVHLLISLLRI
jgi:hypothetical protein